MFRVSKRDAGRRSFTLVELLTSIAIIGILAALLLPALQEARNHAKYARWLGFKNSLRTDPRLVAYYDFEITGGTAVKNGAVRSGDFRYRQKWLDATIESGTEDPWSIGRWTGKGALRFDGTGEYADYLDTQYTDTLDITGEITMEAWVRRTEEDKEHCVLDRGGSAYQFYVSSSNKLSCVLGSNTCNGDTNIPENRWKHIVVTWDGTDVNFYLDGELDGSSNPSITMGTTTNVLRIGAPLTGTSYFKGRIDELALYDSALSANEIKEHYKMGKPLRERL